MPTFKINGVTMQINKSIILFLLVLALASCGSKTTTIDPSLDRSDKSDECAMEKEICDDALDFQQEYNRMPAEQQEELKSVLSSYVEQCADAQKACEKSLKD